MTRTALVWCPRCSTLHRGACPVAGRARGRRRKTTRNIADEEERRKILKRHRDTRGDVCPGTPWCAVPDVAHPCADLTVDHSLAQAKGGTLSDGYLVMCRSANSRKGSG